MLHIQSLKFVFETVVQVKFEVNLKEMFDSRQHVLWEFEYSHVYK
jgi:hypothetical protein